MKKMDMACMTVVEDESPVTAVWSGVEVQTTDLLRYDVKQISLESCKLHFLV